MEDSTFPLQFLVAFSPMALTGIPTITQLPDMGSGNSTTHAVLNARILVDVVFEHDATET